MSVLQRELSALSLEMGPSALSLLASKMVDSDEVGPDQVRYQCETIKNMVAEMKRLSESETSEPFALSTAAAKPNLPDSVVSKQNPRIIISKDHIERFYVPKACEYQRLFCAICRADDSLLSYFVWMAEIEDQAKRDQDLYETPSSALYCLASDIEKCLRTSIWLRALETCETNISERDLLKMVSISSRAEARTLSSYTKKIKTSVLLACMDAVLDLYETMNVPGVNIMSVVFDKALKMTHMMNGTTEIPGKKKSFSSENVKFVQRFQAAVSMFESNNPLAGMLDMHALEYIQSNQVKTKRKSRKSDTDGIESN